MDLDVSETRLSVEKVYENALVIELQQQGFHVERQKQINVSYKGEVVGEYYADIIINRKVLLELKAQPHLNQAHEAQLLNYLKATGIKIGLLVNFTFPKAVIKRFIF